MTVTELIEFLQTIPEPDTKEVHCVDVGGNVKKHELRTVNYWPDNLNLICIME